MQKIKTLIFAVSVIVVFILVGLFFIGYFRPKSAGLNVYANQESSVFVDGELIGKTPIQKTLAPKDIVLKIIPLSGQSQFESKLTLTPGVETMIRRDFNDDRFDSAGEAVSFEKTNTKAASFVVVSVPDKAQISIDGVIQGFAPHKTESVSPGEHQVLISSPGYQDRAFTIKAYAGYKLTAVIELAKSSVVELPSPTVKKVQISPTPNGFLRVRENPSTTSAELVQVQPGSIYNFQEERSGWYGIEYSSGLFGWVASEYAEIIETN